MRAFPLVALALASGAIACNECSGTFACRVEPEISYSGQVIDRATRRGVGGTQLWFVRDSGTQLVGDSVNAVSDPGGFFVIRASTERDGVVHGHLRVAAPAPNAPYTIPVISLTTSRTLGDGGFIGRVVTKPFFRLVGFVHDRKTGSAIEGATVFWRRTAGGRVSQDTITFTAGAGGAFSWLPEVTDARAIEATFQITAPGYPRTFSFDRKLELQYFDNALSIQQIPVGMGFPQFAVTGRRGTGEPLVGTTVTLTRISGVATTPSQVTIPTTEFGAFGFPLEPQQPGTAFVEVRVNPPAPFAAETRVIPLPTSDDDLPKNIGFMGFGAHVFFGAELRDSDGALIPEGTAVRIRRVSGLPLLLAPDFPDGDHRPVNAKGRFEYGTPMAGAGSVTFDLTVQHPEPFVWDTVRGITVQSRFNDTIIDVGPLTLAKRRKP
jgi:hypothetical protein